MSRLAKKPIFIPSGVTVDLSDRGIVVAGPKGSLKQDIRTELVSIKINDGNIEIHSLKSSKLARALTGTYASLIKNMIQGVTAPFNKKLEIEGVGYRALVEGNGELVLTAGFSHPVRVSPPEGIMFSVEKNTINVVGISKEIVGRVAAQVRSIRKPEPYKGTGIRYAGEVIRRKAGKKSIGSTV